jgi:glycosyltransferase involved in cell wall biosynthesis
MVSLKSLLRVIFTLGLLSSLALLIYLISTPSEGQNAVWLGFSRNRLIINGMAGLFVLGFSWLTLRVWRKPTSAMFSAQAETWLLQPTRYTLAIITSLLVFFIGSLSLVFTDLAHDEPFSGYLIGLLPLMVWLTFLGLVFTFSLVVWRFGWHVIGIGVFVVPLVISLVGVRVHLDLWKLSGEKRNSDIFNTYKDGYRLFEGENPYIRVLGSDMLHNEDYPTYFPLFYLLSTIIHILGIQQFANWLAFWRFVFLLVNISIGLLLYGILYKRGLKALALFAILFWLFNRWTLGLSFSADLDFLPIFLVTLSLIVFPSSYLLSGLLFGLSLSLKQIAIFLIPLYLIWAWKASPSRRVNAVVNMSTAVAFFPIVTSLPFLIWSAEGYIKSVFFSISRLADVGFNSRTLDFYYGWVGFPARIPMIAMLIVVYIMAFYYRKRVFSMSLLVMGTFAFFNPVIFNSYMAWLIPLIPLVVSETFKARTPLKWKLLDHFNRVSIETE